MQKNNKYIDAGPHVVLVVDRNQTSRSNPDICRLIPSIIWITEFIRAPKIDY